MDGWMGRLYHTARTVYDVSPLRLVGVRVQEVKLVLRVHDIFHTLQQMVMTMMMIVIMMQVMIVIMMQQMVLIMMMQVLIG